MRRLCDHKLVLTIVWLLTGNVIMAKQTIIYVQERFDMKDSTASASLCSLSSQIPLSLKSLIDRSKALHAEARLVKSIDSVLQSRDTVYALEASCREEDGNLHVEGEVISAETNETDFKVEFVTGMVTDESRERIRIAAEKIAEDLFEDLVIGFKKKIRIVIVPFKQLGGDEKYRFLEEAIPAILKTNLAVSPKLTLVEIRDSLYAGETEKERRAAFDNRTMLEIGRRLIANYGIIGSFWEIDSQLRIDMNCLSIATGEIIFSRGMNIGEISINGINAEMTKLASGIRSGIVEDITVEYVGTSVAVVGVPPVPNTKENRIRTGYLVDALTKKLKKGITEMSTVIVKGNASKPVTQEMWIKQDRAKIDSYLNRYIDTWAIAAELDVDRLVTVQYEDYGDGDVVINMDVFDHENPSRAVISYTEPGDFGQIDELTNKVAKALFRDLLSIKNDAYMESVFVRVKDISVRKVRRVHGFAFSYNNVVTSTDGPLEYKQNSSFLAYMSFAVPFRSQVLSTHVEIVPMLTWDWGDNTLENLFSGTSNTSVHLFSGFLSAVYKFLPERGINPYAGIGIGCLVLRRIYDEENNFIHAPSQLLAGYAGIMGCEFKVGQVLSLVLPFKYYHSALGSFDEETRDGRHFNGGSLWGLNFGFGIKCNW